MKPGLDQARLPTLDGLLAVEAAGRLGTFERAADELAITASAVAKRVAAVEALLGTALFLRTGKQLQPTADGLEYLPQLRAALAQLAAVPLHRRQRQRQARLRVLAPPTFARQVLVPALAGFTAAHPALEVELQLSAPFSEAPQSEAADVELRHGDVARLGALGWRRLVDPAHDLVLPLAAPALLARLPPLRRPADLAAAPLLRTPIEPWTPWLRAAGLDWPEPDGGPRLVDLGLTLEAAVAGQGLALARPALARRWLASGELVAPFELLAPASGAYQLLLPAPADASCGAAAATAFADWLAGVADDAAREGLALLHGSGRRAS
ncbi:MAG: LysR family transcriptional regulator [Burkholderiaceae bacterium]|nr:LysR family transcriptional regulator [Burkholderiaceae bacterium]